MTRPVEALLKRQRAVTIAALALLTALAWAWHRRGFVAASEAAPDEVSCTAAMPEGCSETFSRSLLAGEHVLEVYEWTNTEPDDSEYPPIGRTCFDVTVTQP
jgi:hypothetical protein